MPRAAAEPPNGPEVIVGKSYGSRDANLADAARRWWKLSRERRDQLEFIVARRRWAMEPLAVFRITAGKAVDGGRLEFEVEPASSGDEGRVLAAVADLGISTPHCDFRERKRYGASPSRVSVRAPPRRGMSDPVKGAVAVIDGAK